VRIWTLIQYNYLFSCKKFINYQIIIGSAPKLTWEGENSVIVLLGWGLRKKIVWALTEDIRQDLVEIYCFWRLLKLNKNNSKVSLDDKAIIILFWESVHFLLHIYPTVLIFSRVVLISYRLFSILSDLLVRAIRSLLSEGLTEEYCSWIQIGNGTG